ncbi:hypothetical protein ACFWPX_03245 [Nocardia sp. NPDC058518]|uniref:hypothetical protein n=1 Tax=Nocardia sp. NPDC058518 TaxID=3346534 RepID=UPI003646F5A4
MSMANATTVQKRVLRALQNQAADSQKLLNTQRASGIEPTPAWTQDIQERTVLHGELAAAAVAGGVPAEWVDQARERGTKGIRWNTNLFLRRAAPIDREALVVGLGADIDRLARFTGIHAAYTRVTGRDGDTAATVDATLTTLWRRSAQIGVLLGVDTDEARQRWPHQQWARQASTSAAGLTEAELSQHWRAIANTDMTSYTAQSIALTAAGIKPDPTFAVPDPMSILDTLSDRHVGVSGLFSDAPGAHIGAAVDATRSQSADTDYDADITAPVFSDPQANYPGIDP